MRKRTQIFQEMIFKIESKARTLQPDVIDKVDPK